MQIDVHETLHPFYTTKQMPHVAVTITKNASLSAIARYISITTIYTVRYLQIFNAGHFFSSKHCNDLQRSIGLPWFSTKSQIMTLFHLPSRAAVSWYVQLNMFLKISGGNCPVALPLIAGSASKTCQYHLEQWFSNFHEPWRPSKDSQHLWPPAHQ